VPSGVFNDLGVEYSYRRAAGLMTEPNPFGSLALGPFAVALWRWGRAPGFAWPRALLAGALAVGLVCALTRVVWLLALGLGAPWCWRLRPGRAKGAFVAATVAATLGAVLVSELPMTRGDLTRGAVYRQTWKPAATGADTAVAGRLMELETGLAAVCGRPLLGHGPRAVNRLEQWVIPGQVRRWRGLDRQRHGVAARGPAARRRTP
jgi:O-antigen ligase